MLLNCHYIMVNLYKYYVSTGGYAKFIKDLDGED